MIKNMKKYIASLIMVLFLSSCFSMNGTQYIQKSNVYKYDISLKISKDLYESFNQKSNHVLKDFDIVELKSIIDLSKYKLNDSEFKSKSVWVKAKLETNQELDNLIKNITQLDGVFDAELNSEFKVEAYQQKIINNPKLVEQWYMQNANIPNAWSWMEGNEYLAGGDPSIVIAVIDTGVDYLHEDLRDNMWINYGEIPNNGIDDDNNGFIDDIHGVNVVSDERFHSGNPMDDHGHGTHVAGIIASSNNYIGTVGVAYNSKIMAIKAATASGTLFNTDIAEAIMYAYNNGADIINMSFGGGTASNLVQEALSIAYTNTILVASAGNSGLPNQPCPKGSPVYPAAYPYVIGVMSHNQNDNPSSFSNWDCKAYNYLEYDVYAPGEGIISTLPNNQYAAWSGTSMAAPIVSGIAALLRTHFTDFNEYPNKFIMGQIIGNADFDEIKFSKHGQVNALSALTNRPVPNVNLFETYVFDSEDINENNNGDRIIDSGETIAVGFDINNRWGKAKNTTITLDSKSPAGIDNPWIQFVNNQYVFGDIGYLSNKDNNKIWVNQELVGFEDPLLIHILETTPNDMVIKINVTITYENAMDESDTNIYTKKDSFTVQVRNGFLLPRVIEEDMVLNSDNYYIISDSTLIAAGVTVEITEGTKIQFGTAAMEEPYKVVLKPSLTVRGTLHISGSKDNLVELFPSELLYDIPVVIDRSDNGLIIMEYAKITNGYLNISSGSHLILDQNTDFFQYPRDYNGTLYMDSVNNIVITADLIENSIFRNLNNVVIDSSLKNNMFYNNAVQLLLGNNNLQTYFDYYKMQYIHPSYRPSSRYYHNNLFLSNNKFIYNAISSSGGSYVPSEFLIGSNSGDFKDNAILNNFTSTKLSEWLRIYSYYYYSLTSNALNTQFPSLVNYSNNQSNHEFFLEDTFFGTLNSTLLDKMFHDYYDTFYAGKITYTYADNPHEDMFPFVTDIKIINESQQEVFTVGKENITIQVKFNRDMNTSIDLNVSFGSSMPYAEYIVKGSYIDSRTWQGQYQIVTNIESGIQYLNISNGEAASDSWQILGKDIGRFFFEIDTTEALALVMQGYPTNNSIELSWTQDDFDTLIGFNLYRSQSINGPYIRLNQTIIPNNVFNFSDTSISPGEIYYYNFTVVKSDLSESLPSGRITLEALDTLEPDIYHTPVYFTQENRNLVIKAIIIDNVQIRYSRLFFRIKGSSDWIMIEMTKNNDQFLATIPGNNLIISGLEYYIETSDGINKKYFGTIQTPIEVIVKSTVENSDLGDINKDGMVTVLDALMILQAINGLINLDLDSFNRADLNRDGILQSFEALRILQYVVGNVGSLQID